MSKGMILMTIQPWDDPPSWSNNFHDCEDDDRYAGTNLDPFGTTRAAVAFHRAEEADLDEHPPEADVPAATR